jgi:hypothetical protein
MKKIFVLMKMNGKKISSYEYLSEEFIAKYKDYVNWNHISSYQVLCEEFIIEFKDDVNWIYISVYQNISEELIYKFRDRIYYCDNIKRYLNEKYNMEYQVINYIDYCNLLLHWNSGSVGFDIVGFDIENKPYSLLMSEII